MVAGHGRENVVELFFQRRRRSGVRERVGDVAHHFRQIGFRKQRRRLADRHRAGAEGLDHQSEVGEGGRVFQQTVHIGGVEFDHHGDQLQLPLDARFGALALQPLINNALVRGVLVDDDEAIAGLRDNIGVVNLRSRGAKWRLDIN